MLAEPLREVLHPSAVLETAVFVYGGACLVRNLSKLLLPLLNLLTSTVFIADIYPPHVTLTGLP
jgi:hypothetical protein